MNKLDQIKIPLNLISEEPERWVIVEVDNGDESFHRVYGSWAGGYTDGDRWKLNSGITKVEEDETHYYFYGYSGSCYKCHKKGYGVATSYCRGVLNNLVEKAHEADAVIIVKDEDTDWNELLNKNK